MANSSPYERRVRALLEHLWAVRRGKGITTAAVARAMGTSQPFVSKLEHSSPDCRISTVLRYADVVGLELALVEVRHVG